MARADVGMPGCTDATNCDFFGTTDLQNRVSSGTRDIETWVNDLIVAGGKNAMVVACGNCTKLAYDQNGRVMAKDLDLKTIGIVGMLNGTIAMSLATPPQLDTIHYLAYIFDPVAKSAHAQTGSTILSASGLFSLWTTVRNVSYIMLIGVLIFIGLSIMFKAKVDPKTVITAQMALPKVVMALILITFSYSLGGLFMDITNAILSLLANIFNIGSWSNLINLSLTLIVELAGLPILGVLKNWLSLLPLPAIGPNPQVGGHSLSRELPGMSTIDVGLGGLGVSAYIIGPLIGFMVLFAIFNVFVALYGEWVQMVLRTIFAPIFFLMEAIPSKEGGMSWLKNQLASAISIPVMAMFLDLSFRFAISTRDLVNPPYTKTSGAGTYVLDAPPALFTDPTTHFVERIASFGLLTAVTMVPAAIKNAFGVLTPGGVAGAAQKPSQLQSTAAMIMRSIP